MSRYAKVFIFVGALTAAGIGYFLFNKRSDQGTILGEAEKLPPLTVGIQTSPAMALIMVAEDRGFDRQQGVDVKVKEFTAGKFALQAFLGGSLDVAVSGDVPVVLATLQGNKLLVAGQVVARTKNEVRVMARKDEFASDAKTYFAAKKRKLATSFGGGPEFFTYEFLNDLGITDDQVKLISQTPADMPAALVSGSVDAISIFDPFAFIAEKQLGDKAVTFTNPNVYSELYVIDVQPSVKDNPQEREKLEKFLKALIDAEKFTAEYPDEAKRIVMKYTKLDTETVDGIWESFDFRVALTPQLLEFWQREVEWAKAAGKVRDDISLPDFREIIYDAPLREIAPDAVEL